MQGIHFLFHILIANYKTCESILSIKQLILNVMIQNIIINTSARLTFPVDCVKIICIYLISSAEDIILK